MELTLNKRHVQGVVEVSTNAVASAVPFATSVEVIIGLSELIGRIIVNTEGTALLHKDMIDMAINHAMTTIKTGYAAKGYSPEGFTNG